MNKAVVALLSALALSTSGLGASAQVLINPIPPVGVPPPPAPPPPPKIAVPAVPQINSPPPFALQNTTPGIITNDAPPKVNLKPLSRRKSFGDRVQRCLDDGAAAGLEPSRRAEYSRACANGR